MVPALLKWVGSKGRSAETIVNLFPKDFRDYYEPFLGSGAVLAELMQRELCKDAIENRKGFASDNLSFLIDIFQSVKDDPVHLIDYYARETENYSDNPKENYLRIRERFNSNPNGDDFCVLTRTCYSGIIRFRKKDGYMSTPVGAHKPISADSFKKRVMQWHELIQNVSFECCDYKTAMDRAEEGDLIYCDPPYTHSQSILYGAQEFDIRELWDTIADCKNKGCYVALSLNGSRASGAKDISPLIPDNLFQRRATINLGSSMIDRFQNGHSNMSESDVSDQLLLTW